MQISDRYTGQVDSFSYQAILIKMLSRDAHLLTSLQRKYESKDMVSKFIVDVCTESYKFNIT